MRFLRRLLVRLLVRTIVVGVVGTGALYLAADGGTLRQLRAVLREQPQSALMRAADALGR